MLNSKQGPELLEEREGASAAPCALGVWGGEGRREEEGKPFQKRRPTEKGLISFSSPRSKGGQVEFHRIHLYNTRTKAFPTGADEASAKLSPFHANSELRCCFSTSSGIRIEASRDRRKEKCARYYPSITINPDNMNYCKTSRELIEM